MLSKEKRQSAKVTMRRQSSLKNSRNTHFIEHSSYLKKEFQDKNLLQQRESTKRWRISMQKNMEGLKQQLLQLMMSFQTQNRKNLLFKQLTEVLKSQMNQLKLVQKQKSKIEQQVNKDNNKLIRKVQHDIDQIQQKYNEEVAKINALRQMTGSVRSERVVYSNLFNKIEKEIKRNQQFYKSIITETEIQVQDKPIQQLDHHQLQNVTPDQPQIKEDFQFCQSKSDGFKHQQHFNNSYHGKLFLTNPHQKWLHADKKKSHRPGQSCRASQSAGNIIEITINQLQTNIQKIVKMMECQNKDQALTHYHNIQNQNQELLEKIDEQEQNISWIQTQIERLKLQRRNSQMHESRQLNLLGGLPSMRKIRSKVNGAIRIDTEEEQISKAHQNQEIFCQIVDVLGLKVENGATALQNQQFLTKLQIKIMNLGNRRQKLKTMTNIQFSEPDLQNILNQMQKFQWSDKVLDKQQLQGQYIKEMSRTKRMVRVKR